MAASNVSIPFPLTRFNTLFPGQFGVSGAANEVGLRSHPTGTVFYVDPNYVGVSDQRDGTDPEAPLATVGEAVSKCAPYNGDVILVAMNGGYPYADAASGYNTAVRENVTVDVPGVHLIGVAPQSTLGVPWYGLTQNGWGITITAADVLVEGFSFYGHSLGSGGIYIDWDGATKWGDCITVRHCSFLGSIAAPLLVGVQLDYAYHVDIDDNYFEACVDGVRAEVADPVPSFCRIFNNNFNDCGLAATNGAIWTPQLEASRIYGNSIFSALAQSAAVATDVMINTASGARNLVYDNYLSCLLPVPANGDYNDCNSASATDAWINNHCMNGPAVTNPT